MSFFEQCVNQQRNLDRNVFKVNISNFLSNHVICFKTLLQTKQEFLLQDLSIRFTRNKKRFYVQIPDFARQFARIVIFFWHHSSVVCQSNYQCTPKPHSTCANFSIRTRQPIFSWADSSGDKNVIAFFTIFLG